MVVEKNIRIREEEEFERANGMSRIMYKLIQLEEEENRVRQEEEREMSLRVQHPDYQINEMNKILDQYMKPLFNQNVEYLEYHKIESTSDGIITLADGRKYKVGLLPLQ